MPNYGYHFARAEGRLVRQVYRTLLPLIVRRHVQPRGRVPLEVFSYSGESALPEQIASIRSFLKHAGRPYRFTVVSDGTYSARSAALLQRVDPSVAVEELPHPPCHVPPKLRSYLTTHPTGKQLALVMSLPRNGPTLCVDSDVLFFPGADDLARLASARDVSAFYLADCQFSGDVRLVRAETEKTYPVNTGVLLLFQPLDWSLSIERFGQLEGEPNFFTNQTMMHLAAHANGGAPLDASKYLLRLDDQTIYPDRYAGDGLALRHYVNPVRHKFWTTLWRQ